jgi:hypothetical protein
VSSHPNSPWCASPSYSGESWRDRSQRAWVGCSAFPPVSRPPNALSRPWQALGYGPSTKNANQSSWQFHDWETEPDWMWTASWEKFDPSWQSGNEAALWAAAWRRMGSKHNFISPAQMTYQPSPSGGVIVTAHWASASSPRGPSSLPQSPDAYTAWYKRADMWQDAGRETSPAYGPLSWCGWCGPASPW